MLPQDEAVITRAEQTVKSAVVSEQRLNSFFVECRRCGVSVSMPNDWASLDSFRHYPHCLVLQLESLLSLVRSIEQERDTLKAERDTAEAHNDWVTRPRHERLMAELKEERDEAVADYQAAHTECLTCCPVRGHATPPPSLDLTALRGLSAELRAEGERIQGFHATMGTGYLVSADRFDALLDTPLNDGSHEKPDWLKGIPRVWFAEIELAYKTGWLTALRASWHFDAQAGLELHVESRALDAVKARDALLDTGKPNTK